MNILLVGFLVLVDARELKGSIVGEKVVAESPWAPPKAPPMELDLSVLTDIISLTYVPLIEPVEGPVVPNAPLLVFPLVVRGHLPVWQDWLPPPRSLILDSSSFRSFSL